MPQKRIDARRTTAKRRKVQLLAVFSVAVIIGSIAIGMTLSRDNGSAVSSNPSLPTAGSDAAWTSETFAGGPRLVVDRTDVHYGDVDYNELVEAVYRLKNVGDEVVTIEEPSIKTLEGC